MCLCIKVGCPKEYFTLSRYSLKQMVEAFELQERQGNTSERSIGVSTIVQYFSGMMEKECETF